MSIGSVIDGLTGIATASVVNSKITKMETLQHGIKSMTGQSQFVGSRTMNQGSLGVSGAYGISGFSKTTASVSAYAGNATAKSDKTISVDYNIIIWGGVEYIDFGDLSVSDFINGLVSNTKSSALSVIDAYNAVQEELRECGCNLIDAMEGDYPKYKTLRDLVNNWTKASNSFIRDNGDGIVVGVLWGGWGTVHMDINSDSGQNNWKYGGSGAFSYSGIGASVSVKATYDGSMDSSYSGVSANCTETYNGNCVKEVLDEWFEKVAGKSFNEIADIKLLDEAPSLSGAVNPPSIPDFIKPKEEKVVSDKVAKTKDLNNLQDFAQVAGFEKAKKEEGDDLTLQEFLRLAEMATNIEGLTELENVVSDNSINVLEGTDQQQVNSLVREMDEYASPSNSLTSEAGYIPIGVWIANWTDLFPWLATGFLNNVSRNEDSLTILRARTMIQDLNTLSRLYHGLDHDGLGFGEGSNVGQIADSFSIAGTKLCQNFNAGNIKRIQDAIRSVYYELSNDAKAIYKKWNEIKFLRDAELGLGVFWKDKNNQGRSLWFRSESDFCHFNGQNLTAFARFIKAYPVISPSGEIALWCVFDIDNGSRQSHFIKFYRDDEDIADSFDDALKFEVDSEKKVLRCSPGFLVEAYPILYEAADGIDDWICASMTTGLKSSGLGDNLKDLREQLSIMKTWGFSSDSWKNIDWKGGNCYSMKTLRTNYIGLVEEPDNVFHK